MPVVTVPATDRATAALADWLIRDLTAVTLEHAGFRILNGYVACRRSPPRTSASRVSCADMCVRWNMFSGRWIGIFVPVRTCASMA